MKIKNRWLVVFLLLPHINIYYFNLGALPLLIVAWQAVIFIVAMYLVSKRITVTSVLMMVFMSIVLISSVLNGTISGGILFATMILVSLCIYVSQAIKNPLEFFTGLYYLFSTVTLWNFITMLNNGITQDTVGAPIYLLGQKNAISMVILPAITIVYIYSMLKYHKIRLVPLIVILIGIASLFLSESGTGQVVGFLAVIFLLVGHKHIPASKSLLLIYVTIFFAIVVFQLQDVLFGSFINNVLHKDISFTGRTYIWDFVLNVIDESWLLGFGRGTQIIKYSPLNSITEAHNGFLQVLLYSGVIGIGMFIAILFRVSKKLDHYRYSVISKVLSFSIFSYMIIGLMEDVFFKNEFWFLLVLACSIDHIVKQMGPYYKKVKEPKKIKNRTKMYEPIMTFNERS